MTRIGVGILVLAASVALPACGGGSTKTPATQLAPEADSGAVIKTVPVYADSTNATKKPNGQGVLDGLPKVSVSKTALSPNIRGSSDVPLAQWLDTVENDVASFWQQMFNVDGNTYAPAREVIFSSPVTDGCHEQPVSAEFDGPGPFYCTADESMYLPLPWFAQTQEPIGDTAEAIVIAHENGHRVQDLLGIFNSPRRTFDIEEQADCLAGIWAASVYQRGDLEAGDIEEAVKTLGEAGDAPGTPVTDPGAHGSAVQRVAAFNRGYNSGKSGTCKLAPGGGFEA